MGETPQKKMERVPSEADKRRNVLSETIDVVYNKSRVHWDHDPNMEAELLRDLDRTKKIETGRKCCHEILTMMNTTDVTIYIRS